MNKPFYTVAALQDLEDILEYISKDKPGAAIQWVQKLEAKCLAIARTPHMGEQIAKLGGNIRMSSVGRYMIFHRYVSDRLEILRVIPGGVDLTEL